MTTARMERRRRMAQAWVPLSTPISAVAGVRARLRKAAKLGACVALVGLHALAEALNRRKPPPPKRCWACGVEVCTEGSSCPICGDWIGAQE